MIYLPPFFGFLIILVAVVWLIGHGASSAAKGISSYALEKRDLTVPNAVSADGRCRAVNTKFQSHRFQKYSVDVTCPSLNKTRHLTAPTYEQLLKEIDKAYAKFGQEMDT